jgi:hypothetical protein
MGTIAWFTWVVALVCVVIGVVVNVALYLKGAFKSGSLYTVRRLEPVTLSREAGEAERDFYMSLGATGRPMDAYVLRALKLFICSVLLVSLFVALLIYAAPR